VVSCLRASQPKPCKHLSHSPICARFPAHLILLDLITLTILSEKYRLWSSWLCSFLQDPSSPLLGPNILLNTLFSKTLSLCSSLREGDQVIFFCYYGLNLKFYYLSYSACCLKEQQNLSEKSSGNVRLAIHQLIKCTLLTGYMSKKYMENDFKNIEVRSLCLTKYYAMKIYPLCN